MKKVLIILAFVGLVAASFSSCAPAHHCPAYGSLEVEQVNANV